MIVFYKIKMDVDHVAWTNYYEISCHISILFICLVIWIAHYFLITVVPFDSSFFVLIRLQLYDLVELKISGDGNCQVGSWTSLGSIYICTWTIYILLDVSANWRLMAHVFPTCQSINTSMIHTCTHYACWWTCSSNHLMRYLKNCITSLSCYL